ncbi:predicted protein [Naegleria gruberi]|uniref:Predicted protein n=1 Tax=Naegleria gruberi TaxID=5762 RepID=D2VMZ0_NAEGR|nr:uncharacterized protein NAEGRDRAFT_70312 [Naegleria gruberi]EFC41905.1 predicted protein [Naegleria gruberi]|eukprot:XP_002674649.1 predicted protein [Naegleria gruberi strain NEG-M]
MKRKAVETNHTPPSKKLTSQKPNLLENNDEHYCFLDLTFSSKLLSTKIADIPHKEKFETIMKPIFEYSFGTSYDESAHVWDFQSEYDDEENDESDESQRIKLKIDWIRDQTFIHNQIFNLCSQNFDILARKFGLWKNRSFVLQTTEYVDLGTLEYVDEEFGNDREIVMASVKVNGFNLVYVESEELKNDKEIVMAAVTSCGRALEFASKELRNDIEIVRIAVQQDGIALQFASKELKNNKEIVLLALESHPKSYACISLGLKKDRDVIFKAFSKSLTCLSQVDQLFSNDREFIRTLAKLDGNVALYYASEELRNDREIVIKSIQQDPSGFIFASKELQKDREIVKSAVMKNGLCLRFLSAQLRDDREIAELALKSCGLSIQYISERLRNDTEFLQSLGKRGYLLRYLPDEFRYDREILLESLKLDPINFDFIPNELKNDREFILQAATRCGMILSFVNDQFRKDREIVLAAVSQNGHAIKKVSKELLDDEDIILKAAETCQLNIPIFSNFRKVLGGLKDKQSCMQFAKKSGECLQYFPSYYQRDREILMEALKTNVDTAFRNASSYLKVTDRLFAIRVVKRNGNLLGQMCSKHRNDREIVSFAVKQNKNALKYASVQLRIDSQILELCNN